MVKYKNGVVRRGEVFYNGEWRKTEPDPHLDIMDEVVDSVHLEMFGTEATVTCIIEGYHSRNSLHPWGKAKDYRTQYKNRQQFRQSDRLAFAARVRDKLGKDYDVVAETTHLHVERDPKG